MRSERGGMGGKGRNSLHPQKATPRTLHLRYTCFFFLPPFPFPSPPFLPSVLYPHPAPSPPLLFLLERASDPFVCRSKCMYVCTCERARAYRTFVCTQISVKHAPYICMYPILARVSSLSCIVSSVSPIGNSGKPGRELSRRDEERYKSEKCRCVYMVKLKGILYILLHVNNLDAFILSIFFCNIFQLIFQQNPAEQVRNLNIILIYWYNNKWN